MSRINALDLQRAEHALGAIEALRCTDTGHYVGYVRALPAAILQSGLGQASATLLAAAKNKPGDPHHVLHDHLQSWLCREAADAPYAGQAHLIKAITAGSQSDYLHAHAEALAYLAWLKKFAVALLKEAEGDRR